MTLLRRAAAVLVAAGLSLPALAAAGPALAPISSAEADAIDDGARRAVDEQKLTFCSKPRKPLMPRSRALCSLAAEVDRCEGFAAACDESLAPPERSWLGELAAALGPVAQALMYLLVIGVIAIVAVPVVRALLKARRDSKLADKDEAPNRAQALPEQHVDLESITDAEAALRLADEHRARGELTRALGLYLAASLAALDRRGAIRIARHRTNGEYVRACSDAEAKARLRAIVREVDRVEFGGIAPSGDAVDGVKSRAVAIVRAAAAAAVALAVLGCGGALAGNGSDPAGDELPVEVLRRNGFSPAPLGRSIAKLAMPEQGKPTPIVVVDLARVPLEEESEAHLFRWVEEGGVLVLFGDEHRFPKELDAKVQSASSRTLEVRRTVTWWGPSDEPEDDDDGDVFHRANVTVSDARVAHASRLAWSEADAVAFLGDDVYAALKHKGKGVILAVANDDLFTNVGILPKRNAAALVTLLRVAASEPPADADFDAVSPRATTSPVEVRVARAEDGIPPPSNPFSALVAAGLGKGAWHALGGAILLFLCYGIRQARPRPTPAPTRRAFAEHVEATGAFYARAKAEAHALAAYGRFVEMRLRERIPRGADPAGFLATRAGVPLEHASKLYERALSANPDEPARGDELTTIKELRAMLVKALEA